VGQPANRPMRMPLQLIQKPHRWGQGRRCRVGRSVVAGWRAGRRAGAGHRRDGARAV